MGKLYANRTLLGNIALVVFLAFLVTVTFGTIPQAGAVTPTHDPNLTSQVDPNKPVAIQDKYGNWIYDGETAKLVTNREKTQVSFTIQVLTPEDFSSILLKILGVANLDMSQVTNAVYKVYGTVYGVVYYVYQFVYTWVYSAGLSVDQDYTLEVYAPAGNKLASITLDLEAPPPRGDGAPAPAPTEEEVDTGTLTVVGDTSTLTVDPDKVDDLLAQPDVTEVEFIIPSDKASEGTVEIPADTLAEVFEAGKPAVFGAGDALLTIEPGDLDLSALVGEDATVKVSILKGEAPLPGYVSLRVAGEIYNIKIDVIGADATRKGGIDTFDSPVTLTLPYDPAKLAGVSEDLLGIYRYNESTGEWNLLPGSKVDKANDTVTADTLTLSDYAVMAYSAPFTDIAGHWAEADVKLLAAKGIVYGMTATTFAPKANVTRAQFAALMLRMLGIAEQQGTGERFNDVAAGAWYAGAVETAAANNLVYGYPDGSFKPDANITREELAAMVVRALAQRGVETAVTPEEVTALLAPFADRAAIGAWAKETAAVAVKHGIVKGRKPDEFAPQATATRAEAAVMVKRTMSAAGDL